MGWVCRLGPLATSSRNSSRRRSNVRFLANRVLSWLYNRQGWQNGQLWWWSSSALTVTTANHQIYNRPHAHLARAQDDMPCDWIAVYTSTPERAAFCMGNFGEPLLPFAKASKPTVSRPPVWSRGFVPSYSRYPQIIPTSEARPTMVATC